MRFKAVMFVLAAAGAASAQTPWFPASGSAINYDYAFGQNSNTNLFGTPAIIGDTMVFSPPNFVANSVGGQGAGATDQFQVVLTAHPGQRFTQIQIQEFGTWAITGVGSVQDSGALSVLDLLNVRPINQTPVVQPLGFTPGMPITTPGAGTWQSSAMIDLAAIAGPNWTQIRLIFDNTVQASTTGANSVATIRKNAASGIILTPFVPAPGTGALLGMGLLAIARRRR